MYQSEYPLLISHHLNSTKQATPPQLHSAFRSFNATGYRTGTVCSQCGCYGHKRQHRFYGCLLLQTFFCCTLKKNTKNSPSHLGFSFEPSISKKNEESPGMLFFLFCTPKKKACKTSIYIWIYPSPPASHQNEGFLQQKKMVVILVVIKESASWWIDPTSLHK